VSAGIPLEKNKNYYFLNGTKKQNGRQSVGGVRYLQTAESAKKNTHTFFSPRRPYILNSA